MNEFREFFWLCLDPLQPPAPGCELTFCDSAPPPSGSLPATRRCPGTDPPKRPWGPSWGWEGLVRASQCWFQQQNATGSEGEMSCAADAE